jgi:hypothetical protein
MIRSTVQWGANGRNKYKICRIEATAHAANDTIGRQLFRPPAKLIIWYLQVASDGLIGPVPRWEIILKGLQYSTLQVIRDGLSGSCGSHPHTCGV